MKLSQMDPRLPRDGIGGSLLERDVKRRSKLKRLAKVAAVKVRSRNDLLPTLSFADRDTRSLSAPRRNVRAIEAAHVREVANAITALGFSAPILIDADGTIIDGVVRVEAAKLLNLPTVPCVVADTRNASERKLLRIALNRLAEKGGWEFDELKLDFEELVINDSAIEITGFEPTEIDGILSEASPAAVEQGPVAPGVGQGAVSRLGDVFCLGPHQLICGDARDPAVVHRLMGGDVARMVLTDEPYNVPIAGHVSGGSHREFEMASGEMTADEFRAFNDAWIALAASHLVDGGILATFIDWRGLGSVSAAALAAGLSQINLVIWAKTNAGMGSLFRSQHELFPLFKKGDSPHVNNVDLGRKGRWRSNVWTYAGASTMGSDARQGLQYHPTVKPVSMVGDALLDLTNRSDIVLDPFLGSGSTLIAAEKTGRVCRGIELDPLYVDVIARRYAEATGRAAILEETGEPFSAVEQRRSADLQTVSRDAPLSGDGKKMAERLSTVRQRTRSVRGTKPA